MANRNILLFDLDGTLVDSAPDLALAVNNTLLQLGREPFSLERIRGWVGNGAKTLIERGLSGQLEVDPALDPELAANALSLFLANYAEHICVDTVLYAGVDACLRTLKQRGYRLAIVTNKPEKFVAPIIQRLGIDDLFECIVGGDTLPQRKPDPEPLYFACSQMGVAVDQAVMVGDSRNDLLAATAAGMPSVGLSYGYNYGEDLSAYKPAALFDEFSELLSFFPECAALSV